LPQVGYTESAVRHTLISLSATHNAMELHCRAVALDHKFDVTTEEIERKKYACHHYNKAVSQLAKALSSSIDCEIVAMITGSLFVILKFMWGDFTLAVLHLHNEIEICNIWQKRNDNNFIAGSLEHNISTLVGRQCFQSVTIGDPFGRLCPQYSDFLAFTNLNFARESLLTLLREGLRLIRLYGLLNFRREEPHTILDFYRGLEGHHLQLQNWQMAFNSLIASREGTLTLDEEQSTDTISLMVNLFEG
jgi:hypothetical protein